MNDDWLSDGRKVPDDVMSYFRKAVVRAVKEKGYSPDLVAEVFGFSRSCVYDWLARFDREGYEALETRVAPGAAPKITEEIEDWLKEVVLNSTPMEHGYDTVLWTRDILAQLVSLLQNSADERIYERREEDRKGPVLFGKIVLSKQYRKEPE